MCIEDSDINGEYMYARIPKCEIVLINIGAFNSEGLVSSTFCVQ